ncbi:Gluconate 2-dehydrogenase (acceptor) [Pseudomonas sp. GM30]|nr:Gluconate 2-dehydrogenase (acceptor) [Pseudomonas sp. GM30]
MNNRRFARTAGWLAVPCLVAAGLLAWYVTREPVSRLENNHTAVADIDPALVARGEYVARLSDCVACHSVPGGAPFAGGLEMATPLGAIHATNITPEPETGIGRYSLADFDRAVRHGVAPDSRRLYPAMPYPSYAELSDDDVRALYAFFMKGVAPVKQANIPSAIPFPLNLRWPIALWNGVFVDTEPYVAKPSQDAVWNRGAYLVQGAGHCGSCHTPRGLAFNEKALDESATPYLAGALLDGWYAPSLRDDHNTGLGRWSEPEIVQFLKTGRNKHAVVYGSMTEAFNNSTQFMSDDDLTAIAVISSRCRGTVSATASHGSTKRFRQRNVWTRPVLIPTSRAVLRATVWTARASRNGCRRWPAPLRHWPRKAPRRSTSPSTVRSGWWQPECRTPIACRPFASSCRIKRLPKC